MAAAAAALLLAAAAGCAPVAPMSGVRIMVPNPPGSGYDMTARTVAATLKDTGLAGEVDVFNLPGAAGTAGMARLMYEAGNERLLLQMGMGLVARTHLHDTHRITEAVPLARMVQEPTVLLVPADSRYRTLDDLVDDWRDPAVPVRLGGGSSPGGPDHLALMLLAERLGIPTGDTDYVWHDGGGEMLSALIEQRVDVAAAGAGEYRHAVEARELRVLAVTGPERVPGLDAPTLRELGIDLEFLNWRGLLAPPDISDSRREELIGALAELRDSPEWREALEDNHWQDAYLAGDDFGAFLAAEDDRVGGLLAPLGGE
ncbi:C4-dicarboxylate ABC transporter substrate-binding protein [Streptomonospora alba]|uniref:C4-dicarboxylate ABC transporter substrate-binding protein n=1 Tax=Streptomonospora alba TaxID=183763 RepID=A0A0C2FKD3_9ACTN|nr:C4-dicarboxylate ABC transporter substrate-binding protein [Streptomonospora alba]